MADQPATAHTVGSKVWVRDNVDSWVKADVVKSDGEWLYVVTEARKEVKVKAEECPLQNQDSSGGVEDMTRLSYLHEPGVLWNLKVRYMVDDIYTYTGTILIAVNPFAPLPHLYGPHMMDQYRGADLGELSPHVYAIADAAYRQMRKELKGQSILVSGESGAGKTETSKLIMKYLAYMGGYTGMQSRGSRSVEEQILESNPLLEAFGNAKTTRNNNSSRFGKYVEINFNKEGYISGAAIRTYLLERSRVVSVNDPERSYHIFYQLCEGASPEEKAALFLKSARDFNYLNQSSCFEIPGVNNAEEYKNTVNAMATVGIPAADRDAIFRVVAAILHLGNVTFIDHNGDEAVVKDRQAEQHALACAHLLGVDSEGLKKALTTITRHTPDGAITSPITAKAAVEQRDSLAKVIYAKLFDWLVSRVNMAIGEDTNCAASVGVLDIYGFESFKTNDFEQFCINLANEKLQQHFNQHVFKQEQAEYEREEIDWSYIQFVDNQDSLDLLEGKTGVLDLLDEQCRFPSATSNDFAQKLYNSPSCKSSNRFSKPRTSQTAFTIDHYAGAVTYECKNFLDKNKDFVISEHQSLLQNSTQPFVCELFPPPPEEPEDTKLTPGGRRGVKGSSRFNSVGSQFKKQLHDLMLQLQAMEPHYVRCIKPNEQGLPLLFENGNALQQLRCGGVLEAVRINCAGFPSKRPYADFVDHFWPLAPDLLHSEMDDQEIAAGIIRNAGISGFQLGKTKVFLRAGQMAVLDKQRTDKMNAAAVTIQRFVRGWSARQHHRSMVYNIVIMQSAIRARQARLSLSSLRRLRAAVTIQSLWRGHRALSEYKKSHKTITWLQSLWRSIQAQRNFADMRAEKAATVIQKTWKQYRTRADFVDVKSAAIMVQNNWRCKVAKRALRQLHQSAREATKLLADKKNLEVKLKETIGTLEVVQNQRNELRQQLKDEKSALAEAEKKLQELEADKKAALQEMQVKVQAQLKAEKDAVEAMKAELQSAKCEMEEVEAKAAASRAELEQKLKVAQDYIHTANFEKSDMDKRLRAMQEELIQRLTNACAQRDEAREHVLNLQQKLEETQQQNEQLAQQLKSKDAALASMQQTPMAMPPGASPAGTPVRIPPAAATGGTGMDMMQFLKQKAQAQLLHRGDSTAAGAAPGTHTPSPPLGRNLSQRNSMAAAAGQEEDGRSEQQLEMERRARELTAKQQQLTQERRKAEEDRLLAATSSNLGFHKGRPVAALVIFRCCLQWRSFQADRTSLFDRIIQAIGSQIEKQQDDNGCLAYWLTNTVTLLHLLQKNIKPASNSQFNRSRSISASGPRFLGSFFGRGVGGEASIHGGGIGGFRQVEAKYPALLFKQQLDAFVQKIFPMMRDNVKKQITPMLTGCIHTPKGARGTGAMRRGGAVDAGNQQGLSKHWSDILSAFDQLLRTVKEHHVPKVLVQALFKQLFSFVNVQLFNQLLLRRECCSFSNGEYVKTGLAQVEAWISEAGEAYMGTSLDELKYIRQAVTFLVIGNKPKKTLDDITRDLCPVLSIQQLYRISTMYWDDKYNTETVSAEVLGRMKQLMVDNNTHASHSFLLDDDSTLPFQAQEVLSQMDDKDLNAGMPVPDGLKEGEGSGSNFAFLEKELHINPQTA